MLVGAHGWPGLNFVSQTVDRVLRVVSAGLMPPNQEGLSENKYIQLLRNLFPTPCSVLMYRSAAMSHVMAHEMSLCCFLGTRGC